MGLIRPVRPNNSLDMQSREYAVLVCIAYYATSSLTKFVDSTKLMCTDESNHERVCQQIPCTTRLVLSCKLAERCFCSLAIRRIESWPIGLPKFRSSKLELVSKQFEWSLNVRDQAGGLKTTFELFSVLAHRHSSKLSVLHLFSFKALCCKFRSSNSETPHNWMHFSEMLSAIWKWPEQFLPSRFLALKSLMSFSFKCKSLSSTTFNHIQPCYQPQQVSWIPSEHSVAHPSG